MDADQLDLKITGHVVTPGRVLEDGWIGVRGEIVAGLGPAAPTARQVIDARGQGIEADVAWLEARAVEFPARAALRLTDASHNYAAVAVVTCLSSMREIAASEVAPTTRSSSLPFLKRIKVGMPLIP